MPSFPLCDKCNQKHPEDCSVIVGKCFIHKHEGHKWKDCKHLGTSCFYRREIKHFKKECPLRMMGHRSRFPAQSHQQSVTMDKA
jgi:hypothetical protein